MLIDKRLTPILCFEVRLKLDGEPLRNRTLEHFHFYAARSSLAKCGFSWGKATSGAFALYTPEVKML
jgi:hypothetical protein